MLLFLIIGIADINILNTPYLLLLTAGIVLLHIGEVDRLDGLYIYRIIADRIFSDLRERLLFYPSV